MSPVPSPDTSVSIVVPAYNEERSIARTLESLFAQTRPADEIIVADGGSTDRTREVALSFASRGGIVRVVDNPLRKVGAARNVGMRAARSRWVALIDCGNYADPRWLECILEPLEGSLEPVVSVGRILPVAGSLFESCVAHVLYDYLYVPAAAMSPERRRSEGKEMISSSCLASSRRMFDLVGGYPEWLDTAEDKLFVMRVRQLGIRIVQVREAIVYHHMRGSVPALVRMQFRYGCGNAFSGQTSGNTLRLAARYIIAAIIATLAMVWPDGPVRWTLASLLFVGGLLYLLRQGYRPLWRSGGRRSAAMLSLVPVVLLSRDAGSMLGHLYGFLQRLGDHCAVARRREYFS